MDVIVPQRTGIISDAIANAERLSSREQNNVSLLLRNTSTNKNMPASAQFTFTCESRAPGATIKWPGKLPTPTAVLHQHTTQLLPCHRLKSNSSSPIVSGNTPTTHAVSRSHTRSSKAGSGQSSNLKGNPRQRLQRQLNLAARNRRHVASEKLYSHTPKANDIWMCEFCEYERIFGEPPRALIREYEIKDRRHRQEEADRKRLLEKAKSKSRKGKKHAKINAKDGQASNHTSDLIGPQHHEGRKVPQLDSGYNHSVQSDIEGEDNIENRTSCSLSLINERDNLIKVSRAKI